MYFLFSSPGSLDTRRCSSSSFSLSFSLSLTLVLFLIPLLRSQQLVPFASRSRQQKKSTKEKRGEEENTPANRPAKSKGGRKIAPLRFFSFVSPFFSQNQSLSLSSLLSSRPMKWNKVKGRRTQAKKEKKEERRRRRSLSKCNIIANHRQRQL